MARLFISYSRADASKAERLERDLKAQGHEVWRDETSIVHGDSFTDAIAKGLDTADFVIACLSGRALESESVRAELGSTLAKGFQEKRRRLIPVRFEDVAPTGLLRDLHYIDLFPEARWDTGVQQLWVAIRKHEARADPPSPVMALPPNNLPPGAELFVGREQELLRLKDWLLPGPRVHEQGGLRCSLYGLGGMGKSTIALTFATRNAGAFSGGIYWVDARGAAQEALARLATELRLLPRSLAGAMLDKLPPEATTQQLAQAVTLALRNMPEPALLILDGADSPGWLSLLPSGPTRVLMTTRDRDVNVGQVLHIEPLPLEQARKVADVIHRVVEPAEFEARDRVIGGLLQCLPLAVSITARAQHRWALTWVDLERELRVQPAQILEDERLLGGHPVGVLTAIDWALDRCEPQEMDCLRAAAVFAPERISQDWMAGTARLAPKDLDFRRAVDGLVSLDLVSRSSGQTLSLHPLVWRRVRERTEPAIWAQFVQHASDEVEQWLKPRNAGLRLESMSEMDAARPHLEVLLRETEAHGLLRSWFHLMLVLASYLRSRGEYEASQRLCERIVTRAEQSPEMPDAYRASGMVSLATVLQKRGPPVPA